MNRPRRLTPGLLASLGILAAIGPLATDFYLSSFAAIAADLNASPSQVQLTLTGFLLGIAVGQLVLGPLSDQVGRRPVMLVAMAIFAATSIAVALAPTIELIIALRVIQGLSGAAGIVVARAIAVDLSDGDTAVRALSLIAMVAALGPIVAPLLGGGVAAVTDWHGAFWTLAIIAVVLFVLALVVIPESLPVEQRHAGGLSVMLSGVGQLLTNRTFVGYLAAFALGYGAMMAYISASPFVVQTVFGLGVVAYSLGYATSAAALILSNLTNARVAPRVGPRRMLGVGQSAALLAALVLVTVTLTGLLNWPMVVGFAFLLVAGTGFTMANASALAFAQAPHTRGSASALLGATQFGVGAIVAPMTGAWGATTAVPMVTIMLVSVTLGAVLSRVLTRRAAPTEL